MTENELARVVNQALGKPADFAWVDDAVWDSLDQLEIITHLTDELGEQVNSIEALNKFSDLRELTGILRTEGLVD